MTLQSFGPHYTGIEKSFDVGNFKFSKSKLKIFILECLLFFDSFYWQESMYYLKLKILVWKLFLEFEVKLFYWKSIKTNQPLKKVGKIITIVR